LGKLATELESQNAAQRSRFQEGEGRQGLAALSNALIAAGEATRGQKGFGGIGAAFGGFGKAYNASTAEAEQRAAKQQALERAQTIETMKLQSDIEQMQRAYAEGDIDKAMKLKEQINARQAKIEEMKGTGAKEVLTQQDRIKQRAEQERSNKEKERLQKIQADSAAETARYARENKPTAEEKNILAVMGRLNKDPEYMSLLKKRENFNPGDPEFDAIQDVLDSIRDAAFKDLKLTAPTKRERLKSTAPPEDTRSFLDKLSGKPAPGNFPSLPPGFVPVK
jgi:murein L,D-transpeptidase YcbB/YkuD